MQANELNPGNQKQGMNGWAGRNAATPPARGAAASPSSARILHRRDRFGLSFAERMFCAARGGF